MPRILVVVDGTAEASLALDGAMDVASALPDSELILLGIVPELSPWQAVRVRRPAAGPVVREILLRAVSSVAARGLRARLRVETGEKADVVTKVAGEEGCDHIFIAETGATPAARALIALTSVCTGRATGRIISKSDVPVTVVASKGPRACR